ncbi:transglycosylase SLT domain-containing protein [Ramlibacter sp. AW1]|uniref:Transglycosylase SLT domain-containing protein n=1 Tax=Ramlibacter aurantiacus TaxID=2801330 RepID=A0A936ZDY6_9BURK|nr:transglycosylase SLT domain-containing protein [Ramlibacter aurantiacus]MBL0419814.1 transglycosylase SLT domain-containing protein [Ramlibacter aurantiacus]
MRRTLPLAVLASTLWLAGCASVPGEQAAPPVAAANMDLEGPAPATPATPSIRPAPTVPVPVPATQAPPLRALPGAEPLRPITVAELASDNVATMEPPADLWQRIRSGFKLPDLEGGLVRQHEQWYSSRPDYIQRMTERSRKYLFHIVEELERRGMPTELALLPYIESAFNPQAVSSARAAGMWQFMPATGIDFDLRQNMFRDDRRDVLASTRAALDYLQMLHNMFGDWHLALAAYNWGQGNVGRAIQRNQRAGQGTSYTELHMPTETRHYVPKLQAVKNIVFNPDNYRTELPVIENHPYFQEVDITRDIDVELAAKLADVRLEDFKALNPSLNRPVILAAGTPQILLPWDNAKVFRTNLAAYTAGQYASWTTWTAPATMSVGEAARRVGMSEADFRSVNAIPPRMLIRAGSVVLAPRSETVRADVPGRVADNAQLHLAPEVLTRRTVVKARKGDTVTRLAARYRLKASDVADWNDLAASAALKTGASVVLHLPVRATSGRRATSTARSSRKAAPAQARSSKKVAPRVARGR